MRSFVLVLIILVVVDGVRCAHGHPTPDRPYGD